MKALSVLLLLLLCGASIAETSTLNWNGRVRFHRHPKSQFGMEASTGPTGNKGAPKATGGKGPATGPAYATGPAMPSSLMVQAIDGGAKIQLKGRSPMEPIMNFVVYPPDLKLVNIIDAVPAGEKTLVILLPGEAQLNHTFSIDTDREKSGYVYVLDGKKGDKDTFVATPNYVALRCDVDGQFNIQARGNADKHSSILESRYFDQNRVQVFDIEPTFGCFGVRTLKESEQQTPVEEATPPPPTPDEHPGLGFCVTDQADKPNWIAAVNKIASECKVLDGDDGTTSGDPSKIAENAMKAIEGSPDDEIKQKMRENQKLVQNMDKFFEMKKRELQKELAELIAQRKLQREEAARKKKELEDKERCIKEKFEAHMKEEKAEAERAKREQEEEIQLKEVEELQEKATQVMKNQIASVQQNMAVEAQQTEQQLQQKQAEIQDMVKKNFLGNSAGDFAVCTRPNLFSGPAALSQQGKELCVQLQTKSLSETEMVAQCAAMNASGLCDLCCGNMTGESSPKRNECKNQCNAASTASATPVLGS